jgi:hypothetical protein
MRRDPAKAILVLDAMLEFFDGGKRWWRKELTSPNRKRACLVGAAALFSEERTQPDDNALNYLHAALDKEITGCLGNQIILLSYASQIMRYNDQSPNYRRVERLIRAARAIAEAELENHERPLKSRSLRQPRAEGGVSGDHRHPAHDAARAIAGERSHQSDPVHAA